MIALRQWWRQRLWKSVHGRLTLLVAAVTVPAFILASVLVAIAFSNEKTSVSNHLLGTTRACTALLDSYVDQRLLLLRSLASSVFLANDDLPGFANRAKAALTDANFADHRLAVFDAAGASLIAANASAVRPNLPAEALRDLQAGKEFVSNYGVALDGHSAEIFVASPVFRDGKLKYVLLLSFDPKVFVNITNIPGLAPNAIVGVFDRNKVLLTRSQRAQEFVGKQASPEFVASSKGQSSGVVPSRTLENIPVISGFQVSDKTGWGVVIGAPKAELYASGIRLIIAAVAAAVVLAITAIIMASWIGRAVVRNVDGLVRDVESVGRGEIPEGRLGGLVETDFVARAVRTNAQRLHERDLQNAALYKLVARVNQAPDVSEVYAAALESFCLSQHTARAAILIIDPAGRMKFVAAQGISETYRATVEGHSPWAIDATRFDTVAIENTATAPLTPEILQALEAEHIRSLVFIPLTYENSLLGKCMVYYDEPRTFSAAAHESALAMASQVAFAITRQRAADALESLVAERTVSLQSAIAQMQEFSYSVSHDLRAPVRAMCSYASIVMEDYREQLPEEGVQLLQRVVQSGLRMDQLIRDLLTYGRVSQAEMRLEPVDLESLIREVITQHPEMQPGRASIEIQTAIPRVIAHVPSLTQAVSNLIANAVKFVRAGESPRVVIRASMGDGNARIVFEDNGIGIAPEHQERIFAPFERLNSTGYEGTGIGLAIVRKAVERMHGRAGVDSNGRQGSAFWIELPLA
ncbi:sensor histidine kinase [Oleiharenicola lentus]|uniref:sensor histidine kinase n=1 Tax=Oleiharenicola lentus TaxID=2508720 RepID=UPI003F66F3D4